MASPSLSFSHFGFAVRDLARMEDFYTRVLGLVVTDRGSLGAVQLVFMSRDPEEHHQVVLVSGRPAEMAFNPINQLSFRVSGLADLRGLYESLQGEAVSEVSPATHGNAVSLYFRDPEGNRIEVFFDTPWYCRQPLREPVDLTQSDDAVMARAEAVARAMPDFMPREQWVQKMRTLMQGPGRG